MRYRDKRIILILFLVLVGNVSAVDNPTYLGVLNTQTIAYAGFAILGIFLLTLIAWGIVQLSKGGDLLALAVTAVSGALVLILAYFIIYNIAVATVTTTNSTEAELMMMRNSVPIQSITNLQVCADETMPCRMTGLSNTWVTIYWEVVGGVGCCNTFGCNYALYQQFCGTPFQGFRLYDIALDDIVYDWGADPIDQNYTYNCSYNTPWNYHNYNVSVGNHTVTILQKDCRNIVDMQTISFELIDNGGTYDIRQI